MADAFTLCGDMYFVSVMGPTDPNRLYTMAASIDPAENGGPVLQTLRDRSLFFGKLTYRTMSSTASGSRNFVEGLHIAGPELSHGLPERSQEFPGPKFVALQERIPSIFCPMR